MPSFLPVIIGCALLAAPIPVGAWWAASALRRAKRYGAECQRGVIVRTLERETVALLQHLRGTSELLLSKGIIVDGRSQAVEIHGTAEQLLDVVENMRIWLAPSVPPQIGTFDLQKLLESAISQKMSGALGKGLQMDLHVEPGSPGIVDSDLHAMSRIVGNVLDHCLAVSLRGTVELTIHKGHGEAVELSIKDSGPTLPHDTLSRIFEAPGPTGDQGTRFRLGLHVAWTMANTLGGMLRCSGDTPPGTLFTLSVPAAILTRTEAPERTPTVIAFNDHYALHRRNTPSKRILVVEDQSSNAQVITATLERGGHAVDLAKDGHEALQLLQSRRYDAAVVDLALPDIHGIDVMKLGALKGRQPMPFIVLTGEMSEEVRQQCLLAGAWAFLRKPTSSLLLLETVASISDQANGLEFAANLDQGHISPKVAATLIVNGDPTNTLYEHFRLILHYRREIERATIDRDWPLVARHVSALHGAAYIVGAVRVTAACARISSQPIQGLPALWPHMVASLYKDIDDVGRTLSALLKQCDDDH